MRLRGLSAFLGVAFALIGQGPASAQRGQAGPGPVTILSWQETVALEHADRLRRLKRLSGLHWIAPPEFHESLIRRADLPAVFGVDIPVLRVVFPQNVFFDTAADRVRPEAAAVIDLVAEALSREAADTAVFVAGHTDSRGDDASNYDLSVRRAQTVAAELKGRGVRQAQIWRVGFGEAVPLMPNVSDSNMARNRRVEFLFARKPEAVGTWLARQKVEVCRGASPAVRDECLRSFVALPRVEAVPVTTGPIATGSIGPPGVPKGPAVLPSIDVSGLASVTPSREAVAPAPTVPAIAVEPPGPKAAGVASAPPARIAAESRPPERTAVVVGREDRMIVDMKDERIFVGRPQR